MGSVVRSCIGDAWCRAAPCTRACASAQSAQPRGRRVHLRCRGDRYPRPAPKEWLTLLRVDPLRNPEPLIRRVYAYVAYRIGDGPDAEDVTSDTFERALRYRRSYDPSRGEPVSWLLGIARRCISEFFTHRLELVDKPPETSAPGDLEDDTARRLQLAAAMSRLGERDRELIAFKYGADLTARQIAQVLGLKTNAVEVALHRALGRLREELVDSKSSASSAAATGR
ncbi:MAG: sigma-70 family RNA polymerase sigma factor [Actinobacteria bacterium]|nr:MAG: sigma-70 family RNA polymerase sigma factor [Actinomycetota bacterium]